MDGKYNDSQGVAEVQLNYNMLEEPSKDSNLRPPIEESKLKPLHYPFGDYFHLFLSFDAQYYTIIYCYLLLFVI